ncbi:MAG: hypothetical protein WAW85_17030 [Gordonia sp. (in: high G+C Gram-positive bacteria)]|uniref:hypothetical protein n=1 Tax=Gordonia sp. (in: high G+C Gram-positive bacteria) TaxID=84139 RepID=UPI003BB5C3EE
MLTTAENATRSLPRLRAASVGIVGAGPGIVAHSLGHGSLPGTSGLLIVGSAGVGLGLVAQRSTRLLPLLAASQVLIHLLLIALTGHHHQLVTAPMLAVHLLGTLAALALVRAAEHLVRAVAGLALRVAALTGSEPVEPRCAGVAPARSSFRPHTLSYLGTVGTRGPPALSKSVLTLP